MPSWDGCVGTATAARAGVELGHVEATAASDGHDGVCAAVTGEPTEVEGPALVCSRDRLHVLNRALYGRAEPLSVGRRHHQGGRDPEDLQALC